MTRPNRISEHTTRKEWTCRCGCGTCEPSMKIIQAIEAGRLAANVKYVGEQVVSPTTDLFGFHVITFPKGIKIWLSSGSRCKPHNDRSPKVKNERGVFGAGGSKNSKHIVSYDRGMLGGTNVYPSNAADGWFYYSTNIKAHRIDCAPILIQMYKDGWIRGLILYDNYRFHIDTRSGKKYFSDRRSK